MGGLFYHDSHDRRCRSPFGALSCNSLLRLAIHTDRPDLVRSVSVRLWNDDSGEEKKDLAAAESGWYEVEFNVSPKAGLVWYYFEITCADGFWYYGNNQEQLGGEGQLYETEPPAYQITVYEPMKIPQWYGNGLVYQVFVDRFCRTQLRPELYKQGSLLHTAWQDEPAYVKDRATGHVLAYDFFGGNLAGLADKLPELEKLGVTILYLNPIFDSVSNHKYDTGDYHQVDSAFGSNEDFAQLCEQAKNHGISVLLDGVFSHTGSDSIYFNRYNRYDSVGAYQSEESPYYGWYDFRSDRNDYDCWWGIETLPNVKELEPSYLDFIVTGPNSVVKKWLTLGAKGWRLDVVDELPEEFIAKLFQTVQETDPEAVVLGEVWEDASNKRSYGQQRTYLLGKMLHSTMNYPFRTLVLDFLLHRQSAEAVHRRLMQLKENYPPSHFYSALNLLGSHDVPRLLTLLGESPVLETEEEKRRFRLSGVMRQKAVARLKLAVLWQMTFPGVPSIYYGDEAGLEGYEDPFNRRPYPWGQEDQEIKASYEQAIRLRQSDPLFIEGDLLSFPQGEIYAYRRSLGSNWAWLALNRSDFQQSVKLPVQIGPIYDVFDHEPVFITDEGEISTQLKPLTGKVYMPSQRKRQAGILMPLFSLPGGHGIGDMGDSARNFMKWLKGAGQTVWQMLPIQPIGPGNSPYQAPSAFAGNPLLIDLIALTEELNCSEALQECPEFPDNYVAYDQVKAYKEHVLELCYEVFKQQKKPADYKRFQERNAYWLYQYCAFQALKHLSNQASWSSWQGAAREGRIDALMWRHPKVIERASYEEFVQYIFEKQWCALKEVAEELGISLIGDVPFYVDYESADVWGHRDYFDLDSEGRPKQVAGVPPDYFSKTGQLWGNPIYRFDRMKRDHYRWWVERIRHSSNYFHSLRLDHFRGLEAVWAVKASAETAEDGQWLKVPGDQIFEAIRKNLSSYPLIAENLGVITPEVEGLRQQAACSGMKVLQFCSDQELGCDYDTVFYTGTHDNDTLQGWLNEQGGEKSLWTCLELVYASAADTVLCCIQDVLGLSSKYRMNRPGTPTGNWEYRLSKNQWNDLNESDLMKKLFHLSKKYGFMQEK